MEDFIVIFIGGEPKNSNEMTLHYKEYGKFMDVLNSGNHFKSGYPVNNLEGREVTENNIYQDGSFLSQKNKLGGLMVIQAKNIDQAAELCQHNPIIKSGGRVIVHPIKKM